MYAPLGFFSNDYLAYCKLMRLRPHPQLLPQLPAVVPPKADLPSSRLVARRAAARPGSSSPREPQLALDEEEPRLFDLCARETLTVRGMLLGTADLSAALPALKHASHVGALVLSRAGLSTASVIALALALPSTTVRDLVLEGNSLEEEGAEASVRIRFPLPSGCAPLPAEIYPDLSSAAKTGGGAEAPAAEEAAAAGAGSRRRSSVGMTGAGVQWYYLPGPSRARAWSLLASRLQRLKRLSLRGNGLGHAEAAAIGDALALNRDLEFLSLSMNPGLGDEGAAALAAGLRENRGRLTYLCLAGTGMGDVGVVALSAALGTGAAADGPALVARAAWEARIVGDLVTDINALGFREQQLAGVREEAGAAVASPASVPAGKGGAAAPAKGGKAAAPAGKEPVAPTAEVSAHPDAEFFAAFRLPSVHPVAHEGGGSWSGTLPANGCVQELDLCGNPGISVSALSALAAALMAVKAAPPPAGSAFAILSCVGCGCGKGRAAARPELDGRVPEAVAVAQPAAQDFTVAALAVVDPAVTRAQEEAASAVGALTDSLRAAGVALLT